MKQKRKIITSKSNVPINVIINGGTFIVPAKGQSRELPYFVNMPLDLKALIDANLVKIKEIMK
jgi:hypothetical protein